VEYRLGVVASEKCANQLPIGAGEVVTAVGKGRCIVSRCLLSLIAWSATREFLQNSPEYLTLPTQRYLSHTSSQVVPVFVWTSGYPLECKIRQDA